MPRAAADHRTNITLTTTAELGAKIDRVVARVESSKNAVIIGVLQIMSEDELAATYQRALDAGLVHPRGRTTPEQRELLQAISGLPADKMRELLSQLRTGSAV